MRFYAKERTLGSGGSIVEVVHTFPSRAKKLSWPRKHVGRNSVDGRLGYFSVTSTEAMHLINRQSYSFEEHH